MKPTDILEEEHRAIKRMLKVAEAVSGQLESDGKIPLEDLERIVDFIRGFADRCHHGKEEDLLFKEMITAGIPKEGGPLGKNF